jgi:hypothetical protein
MNMVMKQFDRIVCLHGRVRRGQLSNTHVLSLASSVAVLRSNQVVGLPGFGVAFTFVNECSSKRETSLFSSPIITTHHRREISPLVQSQSESKLFCLFQICHSVVKFRNGFAWI